VANHACDIGTDVVLLVSVLINVPTTYLSLLFFWPRVYTPAFMCGMHGIGMSSEPAGLTDCGDLPCLLFWV